MAGIPRATSTTPAILGRYPNHEELPYVVRVLAGQFVLLGFLVLTVGLFAAVTIAGPVAWSEIAFFVGGAAVLLLAIFATNRWLRQLTPSSIEIGGTTVTFRFGEGPTDRQWRVPFSEMGPIRDPSWTWVSAGKANFYRYVPATVAVVRPRRAGEDDPEGADPRTTFYLTNANRDRLRAATRVNRIDPNPLERYDAAPDVPDGAPRPLDPA